MPLPQNVHAPVVRSDLPSYIRWHRCAKEVEHADSRSWRHIIVIAIAALLQSVVILVLHAGGRMLLRSDRDGRRTEHGERHVRVPLQGVRLKLGHLAGGSVIREDVACGRA